MFSIFKSKPAVATPEEAFWNWFMQEKATIEKFIDASNRDYSIYKQLTAKIKSYNEILFPELTKTRSGQYVLIITPDGIKEGVEPTKKLAEASPEIENWIVQKFRQPIDEITLNFQGLQYPSSDIKVIGRVDHQREVVDINVFIVGMDTDPKKYQHLAFLYLDHILGEFNTIMKVGHIDFHHLEKSQDVEDSISLVQLRDLIARELY
jgi:hypothetical protein